MANELIGIDWSDVSEAFSGTSKIATFSADNFEVGEISKFVKGADSLAIWVHGEKGTQLKECQAVVEAITKEANSDANMVWAAGLQGKKQVFVLAGWKPKGKISKETLTSAVDAKIKELKMGDFDIKKWAEVTKTKLTKQVKGKHKLEICKECGQPKDDSQALIHELLKFIKSDFKA